MSENDVCQDEDSDLQTIDIKQQTGQQTEWVMVNEINSTAIPSMVTVILLMVVEVIPILFFRQSNDVTLVAALGLGITYIYTLNALYMGIGQIVSVLMPIAYGQRDFKKVEIILTQGRLVAVLTCMLCSIPLIKSKEILLFAGVDQQVSDECYYYLLSAIPLVFVHGQMDILRQYLIITTQSHVLLFVYIVLIIVEPMFLYFFIITLDLGLFGTGLAQALGELVALKIQIYYVNNYQTLPVKSLVISKAVLQDIDNYFQIGISSMILNCLEWWSHDLIVLMSALLTPAQLSAQSIANNWFYIIYMPLAYYQLSANSLVGKSIGEQNKENALKYCKLGLVLTTCISAIATILVQLFTQNIAEIYTENAKVLEYLVPFFQTVSFVTLIQAPMLALNGTLKVVKKQQISILIMLLSYYIVGLPLAYYLTFECHMANGLWLGFAAGPAICLIFYSILVLQIDWDAVLEREAMLYNQQIDL